MFKFLLPLLFLLPNVADAQQLRLLEADRIRHVNGGRNLVQNPDIEKNLQGITQSSPGAAGTLTRSTSFPYFGVASLDYQPAVNTSGSYVSFALNSAEGGFLTKNCAVSGFYGADSATFTVQAVATSTVVASLTLDAIPAAELSLVSGRLFSLNVPCSGITSIRIAHTGNVNDTIRLDNLYFGLASNLATVTQAQLVGTILHSGANITSATGGSVWSNLNNAASGSSTYTPTGSLAAPTTNRSGFTYANMPSGRYEVTVSGTFAKTSAGASCLFRLSDGTVNTDYVGVSGPYANAQTIAQSMTFYLDYSNATTATREINLQVNQVAGGECIAPYGATLGPLNYIVKRFPAASEQVVTFNQAATTSGTYALWESATGCPYGWITANGTGGTINPGTPPTSMVWCKQTAVGAAPILASSVVYDTTIRSGGSTGANSLFYGTYTPTLTNTTNLSASSVRECTYQRIGDVVSGTCAVGMTCSAGLGANTELTFTLPIATNTSQPTYAVRGFFASAASDMEGTGNVAKVAAAATARLRFMCQNTGALLDRTFSFQYKVVP